MYSCLWRWRYYRLKDCEWHFLKQRGLGRHGVWRIQGRIDGKESIAGMLTVMFILAEQYGIFLEL